MSAILPFQSIPSHVPVTLRLDEIVVGDTPVMKRLKQAIATIAPSTASVIITGPTGAGKEVVATALHNLSGRAGSLVAINCGAIPAELIEAELFGHEKGAFTGAQTQRIGLLEQADGGTLFLDEIGDMPLSVQVKLLRALETQMIQRVGGTAPIKVDFRLLAATHRDLRAEVAAKRFREDLLFRIEVFTLSVPPLVERRADIPLILRAMSAHAQMPLLQLTQDAVSELLAQPWAGNVRELRNFHDRAQVLFKSKAIARDDVLVALNPSLGAPLPQDTPADIPAGQNPDLKSMLLENKTVDLRAMLHKIEARIIASAVELSGGSTTQAAQMLRLKRTTLIGRMQKLGLRAAQD